MFRESAAIFFVAASCVAAPGGHLVEAISDECDTVSPIWSAGLRGMPESLVSQNGILSIRSIDNGDDDYPSAEDMISNYADDLLRALAISERPSVISWVWLPPFEQWPSGVNASGYREWFGMRVTAYDQSLPLNNGLYWPGIYVSTDDAGPCFIARVGDGYGPDITIGRIPTAGWWSLGLSWNEQGETEYYAAPGRVALTDAHLLHVTPKYDDPAANRTLDELKGNFWALRMTYPSTGQLSADWRVEYLRVYVRTPPALPKVTINLIGPQVRIEIAGTTRGFRYLLQRSGNLATWSTIDDFVSEGENRIVQEAASKRAFYRVARPEQDLP
ncbi:MAG: hypothetical protein ABR589_11260 [Chthoniobacterales bacterium]